MEETCGIPRSRLTPHLLRTFFSAGILNAPDRFKTKCTFEFFLRIFFSTNLSMSKLMIESIEEEEEYKDYKV